MVFDSLMVIFEVAVVTVLHQKVGFLVLELGLSAGILAKLFVLGTLELFPVKAVVILNTFSALVIGKGEVILHDLDFSLALRKAHPTTCMMSLITYGLPLVGARDVFSANYLYRLYSPDPKSTRLIF